MQSSYLTGWQLGYETLQVVYLTLGHERARTWCEREAGTKSIEALLVFGSELKDQLRGESDALLSAFGGEGRVRGEVHSVRVLERRVARDVAYWLR